MLSDRGAANGPSLASWIIKFSNELRVQVLSLYPAQNRRRTGSLRVVADDHQVVACFIEVRVRDTLHLFNEGLDIVPMLLVQKLIDVHYYPRFLIAAS